MTTQQPPFRLTSVDEPTPTRAAARRQKGRPARAKAVQYLLACDESGVGELQAAIQTLPLCAQGRVFVEVASAADIGFIEVPSRMTVTWLTRATRSGAPGTGETCTRGVALTRAVAAWSDEMLCESSADAHIWLGGDYRAVSGCFEHLTDQGVDPARIAAPEQYRLHSAG